MVKANTEIVMLYFEEVFLFSKLVEKILLLKNIVCHRVYFAFFCALYFIQVEHEVKK